MAKNHEDKINDTADRIHTKVCDMIEEYYRKNYSSSKKDTTDKQIQDYFDIVDRVGCLLLGNALAMLEPEYEDEAMAEYEEHIRSAAAFLRDNMNADMDENPFS